MKILSLFSGIGAFEKALKNLKIDYELVGYCDIDKYASKAYSMIHNVSEDKNFGDITKINADELPKDIDLITYGFPCQDISVAGKQKGFADENGKTRSGLFFDALRIIETAKPKIAIAENVKNLTSKKFKVEFDIVLKSLEQAGYNNYWQVLNAKDYGIPQNRERVFIVSVRKDVDKGFEFPDKQPLELRLKDLLEDEVDEKYYLSGEKAQKLIKTIDENNDVNDRIAVDGSINDPKIKTVSNCITARYDCGVSNQKSVGCMIIEPVAYDEQNNYIRKDGCVGTLTTDGSSPKHNNRIVESLKIREATKKGYTEAYDGDSINFEQPNSQTRRGRVGKQIAQTLTCSCNQGTITENYRIRKLTPLECWRLMGFDDEDFNTVVGISNTQLYKMAGNSIVVDVLENIFRELYKRCYIL